MRVLNVGKALIRRKSDGKYLILTSSKWEERPERSQKPDLPGGVVEIGETPEQGCAREIQEEAGIIVNSTELTLVHAFSFVSDKDGAAINRLIYFIEVDGTPDVTLSWEHESYDWLTAEEVLTLQIREPYPTVFQHCHEIGVLV